MKLKTDVIRSYMAEHKLSGAALARMADIHPMTMTRALKSGHVQLLTAKRIAQAMGCPVSAVVYAPGQLSPQEILARTGGKEEAHGKEREKEWA